MGTLIDTNVLVDIERRRLAGRPASLPSPDEGYVISVITLVELQIGVEFARDPFQRAQRETFLQDVCASFDCLPITPEVAIECGRLLAYFKRRNVEAGRDPWIAATALAHGHAVLTGNLKHFEPVPALTVIPWTQEP